MLAVAPIFEVVAVFCRTGAAIIARTEGVADARMASALRRAIDKRHGGAARG
jgi:hypothetical protein